MIEESLSEKRKRLGELILEKGFDCLDDKELLDYYLCLSTGGASSKKASENLFDCFKSLDQIMKKEARYLRTVDDVSDLNAVYLALVNDMRCKMYAQRNENIKYLKDIEKRKQYTHNLLYPYGYERIVLIKLSRNMRVLSFELVSKGGVNFSQTSPASFAKILSIDKPEYIIVAHNHPESLCNPSVQDITFTNKLRDLATQFNCTLVDHIIVGQDKEFSFDEMGLITRPLQGNIK